MAASSASPFNLTTSHSNMSARPHELGIPELCSGIPNSRFQSLDTSVPYIVNATVNVLVAITTISANILVLLAMRHVTSIRLPSKLLLCSLVLTDLSAGLVVQPQFAAFLFGEAVYSFRVPCALVKSFYFSGSLLSAASSLTLTAISLDRYAALFYYLKYTQIVTTSRVCAALAFIWSISLFYASTPLWNFVLLRALTVTSVIVNMFIMSVVYIHIYRSLRYRQVLHVSQARNQTQQQAENKLNMERYRRTASAMMWVYALFIICYVPYLCMAWIAVAAGYTALTVCFREFAYTLLLLNSCLNPFVYCFRLLEIRTKVIGWLRKLCCRKSQHEGNIEPDCVQMNALTWKIRGTIM